MEVDVCEYREDITEPICYDDNLRVLPVVLSPHLSSSESSNIESSPFQNISIHEESNYYFRFRDLSGNHGKKLKRSLSQPQSHIDLDTHECDNSQANDNTTKDRLFHFEHFPSDNNNSGDRFKFTMTSKNMAKVQQSISQRNAKPATICYVCQGPDFPGKFDPSKAASLGLKKGPKYSLLTKGQAVESDDGSRLIHPSDCISPSIPGKIFIILDCPTSSHFDSILSNPTFEKYSMGNSLSEHLVFVVHLTPSHVLNAPMYQQWLAKLGNNKTQHIVLNTEECPQKVIFQNSLVNQLKLNYLSPEIFPLPPFVTAPNTTNSNTDKKKWTPGINMLKMVFSPLNLIGLDYSSVAPDPHQLPFKELQAELQSNEELQSFISSQKKLCNHQSHDADIHMHSKDVMDILFLGTGSAIPSKYRNVTGIYVRFHSHTTVNNNTTSEGSVAMFLDCGEGTLGQLSRMAGTHFTHMIKATKVIWISHMHADHHLGAVNFILCHQQLLRNQAEIYKPLVVIGPRALNEWLSEYSKHVEMLHYHFVDCVWICSQTHMLSDFFKSEFGLEQFFTVPVIHCPDAFAIVMKHCSGKKLVYSGDTRPCDWLVELGAGADILIHEATFEEGMEQEAILKNHSTVREAIDVGLRMKASYTLLTHFSQRYPKIPFIDATVQDRVGISFDMMWVRFKHLAQVPHLLPGLRILFRNPELEDEE